jgi:hypothetical protein
MYSEARKMRLIEDLIKVKNEAVLIQIESILKKAATSQEAGRPSAHEFAGLWSKEDAESIEKADRRAILRCRFFVAGREKHPGCQKDHRTLSTLID